MSNEKSKEHSDIKYIEVIGDTIYGKHLGATIFISVTFSLVGFFIGKKIFPSIAPEEMVQSYSLLLGIAGSLIALVINTFLFKPKRTLNEVASTSEELEEVYKDMQFDIDEERQSIIEDSVTAQEMKEQGIYEMFIKEEGESK